MRWELKARAAMRGITTSAEVRRRLAAAGLQVSAGKMSYLWSGTPVSVRLDDLEVICAVLGCGPSELLVADTAPPGGRPAGPPAGLPGAGSTGVLGAGAARPVSAASGGALPASRQPCTGPAAGVRRGVPPL
ncbi:DNA-binding Xre family transcriptional regulator [Streptomyces sp. 3330]|uniref:helix-turn-helix domain-containing protein n=1 Tax=Streptomyces sp. 3330 TaxID=2817755 RepID=UPI002864A077|nr:helix-turn-helix transcriptional regulator [Streptomyces sp. 3330]MDR6980070.1 DNA-binding Xre family transcriptional regulator [Streptomyces sp. 3330]